MLKVLIIEDNLLIADLVEEVLTAAGYAVCGIARTVAKAVELGVLHNPDLGVFDLRLANGEHGTEAATALRRHGKIGVLYATANNSHPLLRHAEGEGCIVKPYSATELIAALGIVREIMCGRPVPSQLPHGFRLLAP